MSTSTVSGADVVVRRLRQHDVDHIHGYPGGQLTPLYDALHRDRTIRHILARDEQGAAFMADGYSRARGKPGVCLAVCGPGVLNAVTPLATAYTDSIPFLLISGQIYRKGAGLRSGYYHENEQLRLCETCTKWRARVESVGEIEAAIDQAFVQMRTGRPGPVLIEIPLDVFREDASDIQMSPLTPIPDASAPSTEEVGRLAELIQSWKRPLLMVGGGVVSSGAEAPLEQLAERLGSPVFHTAMGKSALSARHPLHAGIPWQRATSDLTGMDEFFSPQFREADGLLALGCRFTQLATGNWTLPVPPSLAQIDIDASELGRHYPVDLGIEADIQRTLQKLLDTLPQQSRVAWTSAKRRGVEEPWLLENHDYLTPLREALPDDAIVVADITRLAYTMMVEFPIVQRRGFLHPAGYVTMGYGIPAALGARSAIPDRPIVALVGDGCFLMSGMELATSVQENLPIIVIVMNDGSLTLIKAIQQRRYDHRLLGVDLRNPAFALFAKAFGVQHRRVESGEQLGSAVRESLGSETTVLIEVCL